MKVVVSNPGLGSHVRQTILAYNESNDLKTFYSTLVLKNNSVLSSVFKNNKNLKSRQLFEIENSKISRLMLPEIFRLFSSKFLSVYTTDKIWEWSEHFFDKWVAKSLSKEVNIFHCYEHASLHSLIKAKELGIFSVYEQPSAHHQFVKDNVLKKLLSEESFFSGNFSGLYDSELSILRNRRRDAEIKNANLIICNSSYVQNTLISADVPASKIIVHPLGFPNTSNNELIVKSKIRFIVSGNLSYLKGVHHILRIWKKNQDLFKNHELILIGSDTLSQQEWEGLPSNVTKKNRMNSEDYLNELSNSDVLILNTYSDGFGMVMSEAMSKGLAVIGTQNSAAPDILENNITGKVISVGNEDELFSAMHWVISNPNELLKMRLAARKYADKHSWHNYRAELVKKIKSRYTLWKDNE